LGVGDDGLGVGDDRSLGGGLLDDLGGGVSGLLGGDLGSSLGHALGRSGLDVRLGGLLVGRELLLGAGEELALPLGQRLGGRARLGLGARAAGVALEQALGGGVRDHAREQRDRADGVVVARDLVVHDVGVAVGVEDRDDRDAELARLVDREVLLVRVDDPHGGGDLRHVADAAERA